MNNKEVLISHTLELKEKAASQSVITWTNFFSTDELSDIIKHEKINNQFVDSFYYGGYDDAERKIAVFIPKFYGIEENELVGFLSENGCNPISVLKIKKDRFSNLTHRDYLGALMGLGIKREMTGDIIANDDGCTLFCLKSISDFICNNLKQAGRGQLSVEKNDISEFKFSESKTEHIFLSVASLRLDCLVSAAFKTSRSNAASLINQGLVYVNGEQILKTDRVLTQGDKLVLRGKGKTVIDEILGASKKGRIRINLKKYI